jgi:hypothetical protein
MKIENSIRRLIALIAILFFETANAVAELFVRNQRRIPRTIPAEKSF